MVIMRWFILCLVVLGGAMVGAMGGTGRAEAAELVMLEEEGCGWCRRWHSEIGAIYHKTPEGRRAPLRRVDIHDPLPADLAFLTKGRYTPTFILVEHGREFGRIRGYPGDDFFWGLLQQLLKRLPEPVGREGLN